MRNLTVVVGGQFGSEGKGKVVAHLCRNYRFDACVRVGGPNSGHTVTLNGRRTVLRQVPAGVVNPHTQLFIASGCLVDPEILQREIKMLGLSPDRLKIDRNASLLDRSDAEFERRIGLEGRIGSTATGVGSAVIKRILRKDSSIILEKRIDDYPFLIPYLADVSKEINRLCDAGKSTVIEGTQGFGLSLYHSSYYPFVTSRDVTASGFLSEVGVSPLLVTDIILVIRTFPIRVGGNSGDLPNEIDWETVRKESGYPHEIKELTSVTGRVRRVARLDIGLVKKAVQINRPTFIALMGVDYLDFKNRGVRSLESLSSRTHDFITSLERETGILVSLIGTGPSDFEIIDLNGRSRKGGKEV